MFPLWYGAAFKSPGISGGKSIFISTTLDQNPLEYVGERITVVKPADGMIAYVELSDIWHGYYTGLGFQAAIAADVVDSNQPMGFIADLQCTVSSDETTWDAVKSQYR